MQATRLRNTFQTCLKNLTMDNLGRIDGKIKTTVLWLCLSPGLGSREEQGLSIMSWQILQNGVHRFGETHVQTPICFVQY